MQLLDGWKTSSHVVEGLAVVVFDNVRCGPPLCRTLHRLWHISESSIFVLVTLGRYRSILPMLSKEVSVEVEYQSGHGGRGRRRGMWQNEAVGVVLYDARRGPLDLF